MPKKVDHGSRRALIADALIRVAARDGLLAVSVRHVAGAAGVSPGMVQHYFRTKDEMMVFALDVIGERVQERLRTRAAGHDQPPTPQEAVRDLLTEMLPLDEARQLEGLVGIAFQAYAAVVPAVGAGLRGQGGQLREFLAEQIRTARRVGAPTGSAPAPEQAAAGLLALVEGLSLYVLVHDCPVSLPHATSAGSPPAALHPLRAVGHEDYVQGALHPPQLHVSVQRL